MNLTFLNKMLKQQAGFTLTEMMIGGGILAGVGLAGAMLFKDQKMAQKKIDNLQTLNIFHQNLMRSMNNPFNCNATFKALSKIGSGTINAGTDLAKLYTCRSSPSSVCDDFKKGADAITEWDDLLVRDAFIDAGPNSTELWSVKRIYVKDAVTTSGPLNLRVDYQLNPLKFPGKPAVTKDIFLNVRYTTGGVFKECLNSQESSVNNLQNDLCKSMSAITSSGTGATAGAGGGVIAKWNEATQTCETVGDSSDKLKSCPDGMVVEGIRSDGSVHCKYPTTGVSCDDPTHVPRLKVVGGTMKVVCE